MFWLAVAAAAVIVLLAYNPRILGRLLIVISVLYLLLVLYVGATPGALIPLAAVWLFVFLIAWIARA